MAQKREIASADPGAKAHASLEWLELMAYANGCCLLHTEETVTVVLAAASDPETGDPAAVH